MGQAKLRGSFEQRKAAAVAKPAFFQRLEQHVQKRELSAQQISEQLDALEKDRLDLIRATIDRSLANPGVIAVASGK